MSAAVMDRLSIPIAVPIAGGFVKTPPFFIDPMGATKDFTHAETCVFLAIVNLTSRLPNGVGSKGVSWTELSKAAGFEKRTCQGASSTLECDREVIDTESFPGGHRFSIKRAPVIRGDESAIHAECSHCKEVTPFAPDPQWIPLPRSFYEKVVPALEEGELRAMQYFVARMLKWSKAHNGPVAYSLQEAIDEIAQGMGRKPSEATKDLGNLKKKGVIKCEGGPGRIQTWTLCVENWTSLVPRSKRAGGNPAPKRRGQPKGEETIPIDKPKPVEPKVTTSPLEFINSLTGTCFKCHRWGVIKPVPEAQQAARKPIVGARAGPARNSGDRNEAAWDILEQWHGPKKTVLKA